MQVMQASLQPIENKQLQLPAADEHMGASASTKSGKENQLSALASSPAAEKPLLPQKTQKRKVKGGTANGLEWVNKPVEAVYKSTSGRKLKPMKKANV